METPCVWGSAALGERLPFSPSLLDNGQLVGPVQGVFGAQSADVKLGQSTERTGKKMNGVRSAGMCAFVMLCCYIEVVIIEVLLHSSARFKLNINSWKCPFLFGSCYDSVCLENVSRMTGECMDNDCMS